MQPQTKALRALYFAQIAMRQARTGAELLDANPDLEDLLYHCIATGVVTSYARPFGDNLGVSKLNRRFSKFDDLNQQELHDVLLRSRDTIYAHKDVINEGELLPDDEARVKAQKVLIDISATGESTWRVVQPHLPRGLAKRIAELCLYQEDRMNSATKDMARYLSRGKAYSPGIYVLDEDFP